MSQIMVPYSVTNNGTLFNHIVAPCSITIHDMFSQKSWHHVRLQIMASCSI